MLADEDGDGSGLPVNEEQFQSEEPPVKLTSDYPVVEGTASDTFVFAVSVTPSQEYCGNVWKFNLVTPPGWEASVWQKYPNVQIGGIDFGGKGVYPEIIEVKAKPLQGKTPEPGEYVITLEVKTGDVMSSIDLTAVVTARYKFDMNPTTGRLNTEVEPGEEQRVSLLLQNTGTAAIDDITFSSNKPEGWSITFNPDKIEALEPGVDQEVEVIISPPKRAIAKHYFITLKGEGKSSSDSLILRVTVNAPRVLGGAGIGIAVAVIAGLVVLYRRLSMR